MAVFVQLNTAVERCIKAINGMVRDLNNGCKAVLYGDSVQQLQPYAVDNSCTMELVCKYRQNHKWQWVAAPRTRHGQLAHDRARAHMLTWRMWSESQRRRSLLTLKPRLKPEPS